MPMPVRIPIGLYGVDDALAVGEHDLVLSPPRLRRKKRGPERIAEAGDVAGRNESLDWLLVRHDPCGLELVRIEVEEANESEAQRQME